MNVFLSFFYAYIGILLFAISGSSEYTNEHTSEWFASGTTDSSVHSAHTYIFTQLRHRCRFSSLMRASPSWPISTQLIQWQQPHSTIHIHSCTHTYRKKPSTYTRRTFCTVAAAAEKYKRCQTKKNTIKSSLVSCERKNPQVRALNYIWAVTAL